MSERAPMSRQELRRRRHRQVMILKIVMLVILAVLLLIVILLATGKLKFGKKKTTTVATTQTDTKLDPVGSEVSGLPKATGGSSSEATVVDTAGQRETLLAMAQMQAIQYDYDGAVETLKSIPGADQDADIITKIADYQTAKSTLVATSPTEVTHVFFHSLVVDPARGFSMKGESGWDSSTAGFCQWMTTVNEFNSIMQQMYDRGYVLVSIYDLVDETVDENGVTHITSKNIMLPQGKTPFVLSLDDLCYYHSYDGRGTASKVVIGEDGTPACEYIQADGTVLTGSYDCVPLLDDFITAHPDFSYKGAKGTIALTGYNGILGYRTDFCYRDRVDLGSDQEAWLNAHPEFNWEQECAQARAVAECIKADGWTFASHTWGHIRIGSADMNWIMTDTQKWKTQVETLTGPVDCVIFAHGEDLAAWNEDYASTEKFQYMKSQGFNIYCNVDSSKYFVQIGDQFLRMGRRNLDGIRMWKAIYGGDDRLSDLFDSATAFDPARPTDASLYTL